MANTADQNADLPEPNNTNGDVGFSENDLKFDFNLDARNNEFSLYLGTIITALFVVIAFITFIRRRQHSVVNLLAKPDSDAHVHEYILMVKTSLRIGAGLTQGARVAVQLLGTYSDSRRYTLTQQLMVQNILQRAHVDIFVLYTPMELGDIRTIRCSLFNFSNKKVASWRPCFLEVMKSSTRERWGVSITKNMTCQYATTRTFHLIKGFRDVESVCKLIMKHHLFTAPFFNPQRFGAYTSLTSVIFFFFSQSVLLVTSLVSFILSHQFLGRLRNASFIAHLLGDILPVIIICSLIMSTATAQIETFLMSIRPSPSRYTLRVWKGLWTNDYPADLMHSDVTYTWDRPPAHFKSWAGKFSTRTSLSSLDSTSESSESTLEPTTESSEKEVGEEGAPAPIQEEKEEVAKATRDSALNLLKYCMKQAKQSYTAQSPIQEHHAPMAMPLILTKGDIHFTGTDAVVGTTVARLQKPLPGVYCQFCLWVKHLTIRGDHLYGYVINLIYQVRRAIQALRITKDPDMAIKIMTLCINQWTSSLCTRMLKETLTKLEMEQMDPGGLHNVHSALINCESNLWYTEVGYREGPFAGKRKGDNSRNISSLYFSIMRHLVNAWKNNQKGIHGILRWPNQEICPPEVKKKKIKFENKVQEKNIMKIADIMERMAHEKGTKDDAHSTPPKAGGSGHSGSKKERSKAASSVDTSNKNESARKSSGSTHSDAQKLSQSSSDSIHLAPGTVQYSASQGAEGWSTVPNTNQSAGETSSTLQNQYGLPISDCGHLSAKAYSQIMGLQGGGNVRVRRSARQKRGPEGISHQSAFSTSASDSATPLPGTSEDSSTPAGQSPATDRDNAQQRGYVTPTTWSSSSQGEVKGQLSADHATKDNSVVSSDAIYLEEAGGSSGLDTCQSYNPQLYGESDRCSSQGASLLLNPVSSAHTFSEKIIRRMSVQVTNVFKKKMRRYKDAKPTTIFKLTTAFESYANVVQLEVKGPFGTTSCFCCAKALCQTYAVMYSQLKEFNYRVLYHLVAHCISTRHHTDQEVATLTMYYKKIMTAINTYIVKRAALMEKRGIPQNKDAITRVEKELKVPENKGKDPSSSYSYASMDSLDFSSNNPLHPNLAKEHINQNAFKFGKRKAHHGMIIEWTHVPYPFARTILPPIKLAWIENHSSDTHAFITAGSSQSLHSDPVDADHAVDISKTHAGETGKATAEPPHNSDENHAQDDDAETADPKAVVTASTTGRSQSKPPQTAHSGTKASSTVSTSDVMVEKGSSTILDTTVAHKLLHKAVRRMFRQAIREVTQEARWVLGLREALGSVVAFARMDVAEELQDPLKIAIRNFTHAVLVLLFEALLPKGAEENYVVSADDIRQRRKKVSSKRTPGLYDLTENNNPGYDLNVLDFVVVKLCEKWELAKVELQHQPTLQFLTRALTMANLDIELMQKLDHILLTEGIHGLVMERITQVHEMEHSLAIVVNEVMAMTLVYVVPETLKAMRDVTGWLRNEEERVTYVCEKVTVMENQVRHKLSRHVLKAAAKDVQDQLIVLDRRQGKMVDRSERMINKLRQLVKEDYYYTCLSHDELKPIMEELREVRYIANTVHSVHNFQQVREVRKYAQKTTRMQHIKVREALFSLTEDRSQEKEYSRHQLAEVEWIMTGQADKYFPAICMNFANWFMFFGTMSSLIVLTILGASFSPKSVGVWFEIHAIAMGMVIFVAEPIKCIWLLDFGWTQPGPS